MCLIVFVIYDYTLGGNWIANLFENDSKNKKEKYENGYIRSNFPNLSDKRIIPRRITENR